MKLLHETNTKHSYTCIFSDDTGTVRFEAGVDVFSPPPHTVKIITNKWGIGVGNLLKDIGFVPEREYDWNRVFVKSVESLPQGKEAIAQAIQVLDVFLSEVKDQLTYRKTVNYEREAREHYLNYKEKMEMWEKKHKDYVEKNPIAESEMQIPLAKRAVQLRKEQEKKQQFSCRDGAHLFSTYEATIKDDAGVVAVNFELKPYNAWEHPVAEVRYQLIVSSPKLDLEETLAPLGFKPRSWWPALVAWRKDAATYEEGQQLVQQAFSAVGEALDDLQEQLVYKQKADWASAREQDSAKWQDRANLHKKYDTDEAHRYQQWADSSANQYLKYIDKHPLADSALTFNELHKEGKKDKVETPLVDGMLDPSLLDKEEYPGQERAQSIGYPHPGFNADNSDKKATTQCFICCTAFKSGSSEYRTLKGEVCNDHSILEISQALSADTVHKVALEVREEDITDNSYFLDLWDPSEGMRVVIRTIAESESEVALDVYTYNESGASTGTPSLQGILGPEYGRADGDAESYDDRDLAEYYPDNYVATGYSRSFNTFNPALEEAHRIVPLITEYLDELEDQLAYQRQADNYTDLEKEKQQLAERFPYAESQLKRADFTPTFDGGSMDSPGRGLGQSDTGDATFPSNSWMPKGETNKSVSEDTQIGYPGTAEVKAPTTLEEQIEQKYGKEYLEAFILLKSAMSQGESPETSIQTIIDSSDYVLERSILSQLAQEYQRRSDDIPQKETFN